MKKKIVLAILTASLAASLAACGNASAPAASSAVSTAAASVSESTASASVAAASSEEKTEIPAQQMTLTNGDKNIYAEMYLPEETADKYPTVILSHGFGGSTQSTVYYAQNFARAGYAALIFDFCGGGPRSQSDGDMTEMSVLTEASDLEAVMDQVKALDYVDTDNLFLLGESQGGFVSSYVAAQRPEEVKGLILYYPAFALQADAHEMFDNAEIPDTYEVMGNTIGKIYAEDALSFDIFEEIGKYTGPVLIEHGNEDTVAPIEDSEKAITIYENASLDTIEGGKHGWGGNDRYQAMDTVSEKTLAFMDSTRA